MVRTFSIWLSQTDLSLAARGGVPWLWPASETLHFVGMAMLIGIVGLIDLRMLGIAKGLPLRPLRRLLPWGIAGFVLNVMTGFLFFAGDPFQYIDNKVFWAKLVFIGLAGLNVLLFYATGLSRRVDEVGQGDDVPGGAKMVAAASLFLWFGVLFWGRMLPFLGGAF